MMDYSGRLMKAAAWRLFTGCLLAVYRLFTGCLPAFQSRQAPVSLPAALFGLEEQLKHPFSPKFTKRFTNAEETGGGRPEGRKPASQALQAGTEQRVDARAG